MILHVGVANKIATFQKRDGYIVCGNSDYQIKFTFDSEWEGYSTKIARFVWNGQHVDIHFEGDTCNVPLLSRTTLLEVGVYVGALSTTTSAQIECRPSVLCIDSVAGSDTNSVAELNIAFGYSEPKDTSMLWVRSSKPSNIVVSPEMQGIQFADRLDTVLEGLSYSEYTEWAYAAVGKRLYLFGGYYVDSGTSAVVASDAISRIDMETGETTIIDETLPHTCFGGSAVAVGNKIYIWPSQKSNYRNYYNNVWCFDTESETISVVDGYIPAGHRYTAVNVGNSLYRIGGMYDYNPTTAIYKFDLDTNTYEKVGDLPNKNDGRHIAAAVGNNIYFVCSLNSAGRIGRVNTEDNSITMIEGVEFESFAADGGGGSAGETCVFAVEKNVYILFNGFLGNCYYCFDTESNTLTKIDNPFSFKYNDQRVVTIGSNVYFFHGMDYDTKERITDMYEFYNAVYGEAFKSGQLHLHTTVDGDLFKFVSTPMLSMDVAIDAVYKGTADGVAQPVEALLYKNGAWTEI